jgi:hypothetical protein
VQATGIVEALDVSEQIPPRLVTGGVDAVMDTLGFEGVEEALHGSRVQLSLLEPIGQIPPAEAEQRFYADMDDVAIAASLKPNGLQETRGGSIHLFGSPYLEAGQCPSARQLDDGLPALEIMHF